MKNIIGGKFDLNKQTSVLSCLIHKTQKSHQTFFLCEVWEEGTNCMTQIAFKPGANHQAVIEEKAVTDLSEWEKNEDDFKVCSIALDSSQLKEFRDRIERDLIWIKEDKLHYPSESNKQGLKALSPESPELLNTFPINYNAYDWCLSVLQPWIEDEKKIAKSLKSLIITDPEDTLKGKTVKSSKIKAEKSSSMFDFFNKSSKQEKKHTSMEPPKP
jgi:hypothetical protein